MKPETEKLLAKASRAIDAAKLLLQAGDADFAAGRAYYAMFYVAEALLAEKGRRFRRHSAVQAAYGDEFAKPAVLDPQFHRGFSMLPINGSSVITEWRRLLPRTMYAPCSSTPGRFWQCFIAIP